MNVSADLLFELAQASGAPKDCRADGVVRFATERLKGEREFHLEFFDPGISEWQFVAFFKTYPEAQGRRSELRGHYPTNAYRVVELIRRVLP